MNNAITKNNKSLKPYILIQGYKNTITIGKDVIRLLNFPDHICFSVNDTNGSILMFPCNEDNVMAFKVPENLFTNSKTVFRITSKSFVCGIMKKYGLSLSEVYSYSGVPITENSILFSLMPDNQQILKTSNSKRVPAKLT